MKHKLAGLLLVGASLAGTPSGVIHGAVEWSFEFLPAVSAVKRARSAKALPHLKATLADQRKRLKWGEDWELWQVWSESRPKDRKGPPGGAMIAPEKHWVLFQLKTHRYWVWKDGEFEDWAKGITAAQRLSKPFVASALPQNHEARGAAPSRQLKWSLGKPIQRPGSSRFRVGKQSKKCQEVRPFSFAGHSKDLVCLGPVSSSPMDWNEGLRILAVIHSHSELQRLALIQEQVEPGRAILRTFDLSDFGRNKGWKVSQTELSWSDQSDWIERLQALRAKDSQWKVHPWSARLLDSVVVEEPSK